MAHSARPESASGKRYGSAGIQARGENSMIMRSIRRDPDQATTSIAVIKAVHSLIFLSMVACILYTVYSGLTGRFSRRTKVSIAAVIGEGLVFVMNDGRCPLTDLTEELGAEHGSVSDIFLPAWFAERIPVLFSPLFGIGLAAIGVRRARRQPAGAAAAMTAAALFLIVPWFYRKG
ncbi:MAG TPA: hypothetical protein VF221_12090 [Chloroflexota bacterium]